MDQLDLMLHKAGRKKHLPSESLLEETRLKVKYKDQKANDALIFITLFSILGSMMFFIGLILMPVSFSIKIIIATIVYGLSLLAQLFIVLFRDKIRYYFNGLSH